MAAILKSLRKISDINLSIGAYQDNFHLNMWHYSFFSQVLILLISLEKCRIRIKHKQKISDRKKLKSILQ